MLILTTTFIMSWPVKPLSLFILLGGLLLACEDPSEVGFDVQPPGDSLGVIFTELPLATEITRLPSPTLPPSNPVMLVGAYDDGAFGRVQCTGYFRFLLGTESVNILPANVDSTVLTLYVGRPGQRYTYGDRNQAQRINVHLLTDTLSLARKNLSDSLPYDPVPLGSFEYLPTAFNDADAPAAITVRIDPLGERLLPLLALSVDTNARRAFIRQIPGLALVPEGTRHVSSFLINSTNEPIAERTTVRLHYREDTASSAYTFRTFSESIGELEGARAFYQVRSDLVGSLLEGLDQPGLALGTAATGNRAYVQAGTGLRVRVRFPDLNDPEVFPGGRRASIIRAELVVTARDTAGLPPPSDLYLALLDAQGQPVLRNENTSDPLEREEAVVNSNSAERNNLRFVFSYDSSTTSYRMNITEYVIALQRGLEPNRGVAIGSVRATSSVNRLIFNDSQVEDNGLRLRIFYAPRP